MFIEQIIEFELRYPDPPSPTCSPKTGYSYEKTKISKENLRLNYYLLLKNIAEGDVPCFPSSGPSLLQNLS